MRDVIRIAETAAQALLVHCRFELPNEACGYLVGAGSRIDRFVPLTNAAASPTRFVLDPFEQLAAERALDEEDLAVVGVAHSHPTGDNVPSATDIEDAARYDPGGVWLHVLVAPTTESIRAFRIRSGEVDELPLALTYA